MRVKLKEHYRERKRFRGTFQKFGRKDGYKGRIAITVLIQNIVLTSNPTEIIADHFWFNWTKRFQAVSLHSGDIIEFDARVGTYDKGYSDDDEFNPKRIDYGLYFPSKIKKVGKVQLDIIKYNIFGNLDEYNQELLLKVYCQEELRLKRIPNQQHIDSIQTPIKSTKKTYNKQLKDFYNKKRGD